MHTATASIESYNAWLPAELREHADPAMAWRRCHQDVVVHGVDISDYTVPNPGAHCYEDKGQELIAVAIHGETRYLRPEEALELAEALRLVAHAHIDRVFATVAAARGVIAPASQGSAA